MAKFATIPVQKLDAFNKFSNPAAFSALATALASNGASTPVYGGVVETDGRDDKYLVFIQNTAGSGDDKEVTIKAGNGIQGVTDLTKSDLGYGKYVFLTPESGRFKNVSENDALKALSSATAADQISAKGKMFIVGTDANIKVAVFRLP